MPASIPFRQLAAGTCLATSFLLPAAFTAAVTAAEVRVMHEQQVLQPTPSVPIHATAIDANVIVLGAPADASLGPQTGAVYVFERPAGGAWVQAAWLQDRDAALCHRFGRAVDVEGGTLVANHWNWVYDCDPAGPRPDRVDGVQAFERGEAGWTQTFGRQDFLSQGTDLAFDGTSWAQARDGAGADVMTRSADGTWSAPLELQSTGEFYSDDESPGLHLDMHNGLLVLGALHEVMDGGEYFQLPAASLYQRRADGSWQRLPDVKVPLNPARRFDHSIRTHVAAGPRQRIAINDLVFERLGFPQYTESVSLRPACAPADAHIEIQFDEQSALALVRARPTVLPRSLFGRGITLHLYDRITTSDYTNQSGDRPGEYALVSLHRYGDFDFSMKARSDETLGQYSAADYVVLFGYQDDDNYYYMMFSRYRDNNELFRVVNGVRQRIARAPRASFLDNAWHRVEVSRRGDRIRIRFDGRDYLTVTDATFGTGAIGIGSYNDAASFDDISVVRITP